MIEDKAVHLDSMNGIMQIVTEMIRKQTFSVSSQVCFHSIQQKKWNQIHG